MLHHPRAPGRAKAGGERAVAVEALDGGGESGGIIRRDDEAIHPVLHDVPSLARGDLWDATGGGFVGAFRTALTFAGENVDGCGAKLLLHPRHKTAHHDVLTRTLAQHRLDLGMHSAHEHELRIFQRKLPPHSEEMMHAFTLRDCTDEDSAKLLRHSLGGREALHIHPALMAEKLRLRDTRCEEGLLRNFAEDEDAIRERVFLQHLVARDEQPLLPARPAAQRRGIYLAARLPLWLVFALMPVPRRDLQ